MTDWSHATDAQIAERCAEIQGWRRGHPSRDGSTRRVSRDCWWTEARGLFIGVQGEVEGEPVYDPVNNNDQAIALFESEHWLASDKTCSVAYTGGRVRVLDIHDRHFVSVPRNKYPRPTARAICEAICRAHEEESDDQA